MITLELGNNEHYDSDNNKFVYTDSKMVRFEYSLLTLYNWEGKWKRPFLKGGELTDQQLTDFYMEMALDPIDEEHLTTDVRQELADYILNTSTATKFTQTGEGNSKGSSKIFTAEELYALMFSAGVDVSFEERNLNRLLVVLNIIGSYNEPPKKMSQEDVLRQNAEINRQRRAELKTKG